MAAASLSQWTIIVIPSSHNTTQAGPVPVGYNTLFIVFETATIAFQAVLHPAVLDV